MDTVTCERIVELFDTGSSSQDVATRYALLDQLAGVVLRNVQEIDRRQEWAIQGYPSLSSWLRQRCNRSEKESGSISAISRKLSELPRFHEALIDGTVSHAQVAVVCANVSSRTMPYFADGEQDKVDLVAALSIEDTTTYMRNWAAAAKDVADPSDRRDDLDEHHVHLGETLEGNWSLDGYLNNETGKLLNAALDACMTEPVEGDPVLTRSQRRLVALTEMCNRILANTNLSGRRSSDLTVIFKLEDYQQGRAFATYVDNTIVPVDRLQRMLCDAVITLIGVDEHGQPLKMGRALRTASPAQWRALVARDRHCAFPGCRRPPSSCDAHHIREFDRDHGPTDIDNLALLCRFHHSLIHKKGWTLRYQPGRGLEIEKPNGQTFTNKPPPHSGTG